MYVRLDDGRVGKLLRTNSASDYKYTVTLKDSLERAPIGAAWIEKITEQEYNDYKPVEATKPKKSTRKKGT